VWITDSQNPSRIITFRPCDDLYPRPKIQIKTGGDDVLVELEAEDVEIRQGRGVQISRIGSLQVDDIAIEHTEVSITLSARSLDRLCDIMASRFLGAEIKALSGD